MNFLSVNAWRGTSSLIDRVARGDTGAYREVARRLSQGKLDDIQLRRLIDFNVHQIDDLVRTAPNLSGENLILLYVRDQQSKYPEMRLSLRPHLKMLDAVLSWEDAERLLRLGPPEVLLALMHTKHREKSFKFVRNQNWNNTISVLSVCGKKQYEEELSCLPADFIYALSKSYFCEHEKSNEDRIKSALRRAIDQMSPIEQLKYSRGTKIQRELIARFGTDISAATQLAIEEGVESGSAAFNSVVDLKDIERHTLGRLKNLVKSEYNKEYFSSNGINIQIAQRLIRDSCDVSVLELLARVDNALIFSAFLERIQSTRRCYDKIRQKAGASGDGLISLSQVHCTLARRPSIDQRIELARCEKLHPDAQLILAMSENTRVRTAVGRTLGLSQRDLRVWVNERHVIAIANGSTSLKRERQGTSQGRRSGVVYILINPSMPGLVKVGHSTRSARARVTELSEATGVPTPFEVVLERRFSDSVAAEALLHTRLDGFRVSSTREFFRCDVGTAVEALLGLHDELTTG